MPKVSVLLLLILFFLGCAHQKALQEIENSHLEYKKTEDKKLLFPNGLYHQKIRVVYEKDQKQEQHEFNGILKKHSEEVILYSYAGFGISLFKLKDNMKGSVDFSTTQEKIEKNKEFFMKIYPIMKEILFLKKDDSRIHDHGIDLFMEPQHFPIHVSWSEETLQGVPLALKIENTPHFQFLVTTTEFSP